MDNMKIGIFLQALRKAKGYTQQELADYLNLSNKTISKWECGQAIPDISTLLVLAELYEITVDEILKGQKNSKDISPKITKEKEEYLDFKVKRKYNIFAFISGSIFLLALILNTILVMTGVKFLIWAIVSALLIALGLVMFSLPYIIFDYKKEMAEKKIKVFLEHQRSSLLLVILVCLLTILLNWISTNLIQIIINLLFGISVGLIIYLGNKKLKVEKAYGLFFGSILLKKLALLMPLYTIVFLLINPVADILDVNSTRNYLFNEDTLKYLPYLILGLTLVYLLPIARKNYLVLATIISNLFLFVLTIYYLNILSLSSGFKLAYLGSIILFVLNFCLGIMLILVDNIFLRGKIIFEKKLVSKKVFVGILIFTLVLLGLNFIELIFIPTFMRGDYSADVYAVFILIELLMGIILVSIFSFDKRFRNKGLFYFLIFLALGEVITYIIYLIIIPNVYIRDFFPIFYSLGYLVLAISWYSFTNQKKLNLAAFKE